MLACTPPAASPAPLPTRWRLSFSCRPRYWCYSPLPALNSLAAWSAGCSPQGRVGRRALRLRSGGCAAVQSGLLLLLQPGPALQTPAETLRFILLPACLLQHRPALLSLQQQISSLHVAAQTTAGPPPRPFYIYTDTITPSILGCFLKGFCAVYRFCCGCPAKPTPGSLLGPFPL